MICQNCGSNLIEENMFIEDNIYNYYNVTLRCENCGKHFQLRAKITFPYEYEDEIQNKTLRAKDFLNQQYCPICDKTEFVYNGSDTPSKGDITFIKRAANLQGSTDDEFKYNGKLHYYCKVCNNEFLVPIRLSEIEIT